MSFFETLDLLPEDPILFVPFLFAADSRPNKIDLSLGVYQDDQGRLTLLECVRLAEQEILKKNLPKKYPPIDGNLDFRNATLKLIFGDDIDLESVYTAQTIGGSGALRVAGELLRQEGSRDLFLPDPTWPNHKLIFKNAGMNLQYCPYYGEQSHVFEFDKMCKFIKTMPKGSTLLLQASCHNPTGCDPTNEEWKEISGLLLKQKVTPFFDFAYHGFGGALEDDAAAVRYFYEQGHELLLAYSFSKNMGLYGERIGLFVATPKKPDTRMKIASQVKQLIRGMYSMPPIHGAQIVQTVLNTPTLRNLWVEELSSMRTRIEKLHLDLAEALEKATGKDFSFLRRQKGLFSFCGLTETDVLRLREENAIFIPSNGRINVAGLNPRTFEHVINSLCLRFRE
ncbi:MAG: aspartate/tyrosine/aromatic aminotransferase [Parachlamydiaceae bacterium]|nr:aspartate/tyrosine/aromatic aminotransferase [Parachlamydiaceae bacterium]